MSNTINETLCQAMGTIAEQVVKSISFDTTILCTIDRKLTDIKDAYVVLTETGNAGFTVYAVGGTEYKEGDRVYVTIPQGDYNQQKFITAKYVNEDGGVKATYVRPLDKMLDITGNIATGLDQKIRFSDDMQGYTYMGISAKFKTPNGIAAPYGIKIRVKYKGQVTLQDYIFSSNDMIGDVTNFIVPFPQQQIFALENKQIESVTLKQIGAAEVEITDLYLSLGYDMADYADGGAYLFSANGTEYKVNDSKNIVLRWIETGESGLPHVVKTCPDNVTIYWYQYEASAPTIHPWSGVSWKHLEDNQNQFNYTLTPNTAVNSEKIKVVIVKNETQYIKSNVIEFTNANPGPGFDLPAYAGALQFMFNDNTGGKYFMYGKSNELYDNKNSQVKRTISLKFKDPKTNIIADLELGNNDKITWEVPIANSMISVNLPASGVSYFNKNGMVIPEGGQDIKYRASWSNEGVTLSYTINNRFSYANANNTIICIIEKDGIKYQASYELLFGQFGSDGTNVTFSLRFTKEKQKALTINDNTSVSITASLMDREGTEYLTQDQSNYSVYYEWLTETYKSELAQLYTPISYLSVIDEFMGTWTGTIDDKTIDDNLPMLPIVRKWDLYSVFQGTYQTENDKPIEGIWCFIGRCFFDKEDQPNKLIPRIKGSTNQLGYLYLLSEDDKGDKDWHLHTEFHTDAVPLNFTGIKYVTIKTSLGEQLTLHNIGKANPSEDMSDISKVNTIYYMEYNSPDFNKEEEPQYFLTLGGLAIDSAIIKQLNKRNVEYYIPNIGFVTYNRYYKDYQMLTTFYESGEENAPSVNFQVDYLTNNVLYITNNNYAQAGKISSAYYRQNFDNAIIMNDWRSDGCSIQINQDAFDINNLPIQILKATLKGWGDYPLTAYLSIPIRSDSSLIQMNGATQIVYTTEGVPQYDNIQPYSLIQEQEDEYIEHIIQGVDNFSLLSRGSNQYSPKIYYNSSTGQFKITPPAFYVEDASLVAIQVKKDDSWWLEPILILQNRYASTLLDEWDGSLTLDNDNGAILSSIVAAGRKNAQNQFSGVVMGDWQSTDSEASLTQQTGLYGFKEGQMTYAFKEDGTAFIGKSGGGRIYFDGTQSTIESANYSTGQGISIDLDAGTLEIKNESPNQYDNAPLRVLGPMNQNLFKIDWQGNVSLESDLTVNSGNVNLNGVHIHGQDKTISDSSVLNEDVGSYISLRRPHRNQSGITQNRLEMFNDSAIFIGTPGNIYIGDPETTHNLMYQNGNWQIRANGGNITFWYGNEKSIDISEIVSRIAALEDKVNSGGNNTTTPDSHTHKYDSETYYVANGEEGNYPDGTIVYTCIYEGCKAETTTEPS